MKSIHLCCCAALVAALCLTLPGAALASQEKTPENCAAKGSLTIECFKCTSQESSYLGQTTVIAGYEVDNGEEYCVKMTEGKKACSNAFSVRPVDVGFKATYSIGLRNYVETLRKNCITRAGH